MKHTYEIEPEWAAGLILVFANLLVLIGLRFVFARIPIFDDPHGLVLFWWRDWTTLNIACAVTLAPSLAAGLGAAYRKSVKLPVFWGLAASLVVWLAFSPLAFGTGAALTRTGDVLVRVRGHADEVKRWAASSVTVLVSCDYQSGRRNRSESYAPVYTIDLEGGPRVGLNAFKSGDGPLAVDRWIEVLATADDALMSSGAHKRIILTEDNCFSHLLEQSVRDQDLLRLHPYLPGQR